MVDKQFAQKMGILSKLSDTNRTLGFSVFKQAQSVLNAGCVSKELDLKRAKDRFGAGSKHEKFLASQLSHLRARERLTRASAERTLVDRPDPREGVVLVSGRVVFKGLGRQGMTLTAFDENKNVVGVTKSSSAGKFGLEISKARAFRLVVSDVQKRVFYADKKVMDYEPGKVSYIELPIEEEEVKPPTPPEPPPVDGDPEPAGKVEVPDITGLKPSAAEKVLRLKGLKIGDRTFEEIADSSLEGTIFLQDPDGGLPVDRGTPIHVVIAKAPSVKVPKVSGMKVRDAVIKLRKAGLEVGKMTAKKATHHSGRVLSQNPKKGILLPGGEKVDLVIGHMKNPRDAFMLIREVALSDPRLKDEQDILDKLADRMGNRDGAAKLIGGSVEVIKKLLELDSPEKAGLVRDAIRTALKVVKR